MSTKHLSSRDQAVLGELFQRARESVVEASVAMPLLEGAEDRLETTRSLVDQGIRVGPDMRAPSCPACDQLIMIAVDLTPDLAGFACPKCKLQIQRNGAEWSPPLGGKPETRGPGEVTQ